MLSMKNALPVALALTVAGCGGGEADGGEGTQAEMTASTAPILSAPKTSLVDLWTARTPAFGVYVPSERERGAVGPDGERLPPLYTADGGRALAANPLLDYLFLNLEGSYDPDAVTAMVEGLESAGSDLTLLVRIPPISRDGEAMARQRVEEILEAGAHGVVLPHVRSAEEATLAVSFFDDIGADVWGPHNPDGTIFAMLMVEDPGAIEELDAIASISGYSALACGIGSLTGALDGDREAAEAANQDVLVTATEAGMADMITANVDDVAQRIEEGFLGLLMSGPGADAAIEAGLAAAGRTGG